MKNTTLMQEMVAVAGILKGSKLKDISKIETSLESIRCQAKLETIEEAIALTAILDCQCSDNLSSINELSNYFQCTTMEVMMMAPAIKSLISKGYIKSNNSQEMDIKKMNEPRNLFRYF